MMLASALEHAGGASELAGFRFHAQSRKDCRIAERVLQRVGLPFRHYFHTPYTQTQRRDMRLKMGWSGTRAELRAVGMIEEFPAGHMILRGNIMELLRANQWRRDKIGVPLHLVHALRRLRIADGAGQDDVTGWRADYQSWFRTLPASARRKPYDFAFTELYLPNVQGPYINAYHRTPFINPFNDRHMIALATSLPAGARMDGAVIKAIISRTHPELAEVPYV
ncbi:MAG: hypothetical protein KJN93_02440, partial [Alphaproteobacteria bacterium]|nr:hypothetical protein [Alphaproteobacteria bacterium]